MDSMWTVTPNDVWLKLSFQIRQNHCIFIFVSMLLMYNYRLCLCTAAFPSETPTPGRAYIQQKLNNADKMWKKKAKLTEASN